MQKACTIETATHQACAECQDPLVFSLDVAGKQVFVGITTVLDCLKIAEEEGIIPPIDADREYTVHGWWAKIRGAFPNVKV